MNPSPQDHTLRFVPTRVGGVADVTEVAVFPDRLELVSDEKRLSFPYCDMARWPQPRWLWRLLSWIGIRPGWLPIGERDWFHPPNERYIRFYATPPMTIYIPDDPHTVYHLTLFRRIQNMIAAGGYSTFDLG
jgi:hypothetical protein